MTELSISKKESYNYTAMLHSTLGFHYFALFLIILIIGGFILNYYGFLRELINYSLESFGIRSKREEHHEMMPLEGEEHSSAAEVNDSIRGDEMV